MKNDMNDIFSGGKGEPDAGRMIKYLQGKMSQEERHAFESDMTDDDFISEAADGLAQLEPQEIQSLQDELNEKIKKQIKTNRRRRRKAENPGWIIFAIMLIIAIIIAAWLVISKL